MRSEVNIKDLIGNQYVLTGIDFENPYKGYKAENWNEGDASAIRVQLDRSTYIFMEDPDDGYRSMLGNVFMEENMPLTNTFPATFVEVRENKFVDKSKYINTEHIEFVDTTTGKVVLTVGTDYSDDYYPCFIYNYHPENLYHNQGKETE